MKRPPGVPLGQTWQGNSRERALTLVAWFEQTGVTFTPRQVEVLVMGFAEEYRRGMGRERPAPDPEGG